MPRRPAREAAAAAPRGDLGQALLAWYARERRDLPWRRTREPYRILVSEVMCQQTQVDRVVPFYERFLARFPDERALAAADDETIHRLWKGLGYPSRVERLRSACRTVVAAGRWPDTVEGLLDLPGVGPYHAGGDTQESGLAASVATDHADALAFENRECGVLEQGSRAEGDRDFRETEDRLGRRCFCHCR